MTMERETVADRIFVLDLASNPHPRMLDGAIAAYKGRKDRRWFWKGYLSAMADATGCTEDELTEWVRSHDA